MGVYNWKEGARFKADAQAVGEELGMIGEVTPENIVQYAQNEATELHKCFTWDDDKAAHLYRLQEARFVVCSIVTVSSDDEAAEPTRAYESVVVDGTRQYKPTEMILNDDDLCAQVLGDIESSIGELTKKARTYRHLASAKFDKMTAHLDEAQKAAVA